MSKTHARRLRTAVATGVAAAALGLAGCGEDPGTVDVPEVGPGSELAEPAFEGQFGEDFLADVDGFTGRQVTVSGEVAEVLQPQVFALTSASDAVEPILVVGGEVPGSLEAGTPVQVSGSLEQGFDVVDVEDRVGFDLDDPLFEQYSGAPFLIAGTVQVQE